MNTNQLLAERLTLLFHYLHNNTMLDFEWFITVWIFFLILLFRSHFLKDAYSLEGKL